MSLFRFSLKGLLIRCVGGLTRARFLLLCVGRHEIVILDFWRRSLISRLFARTSPGGPSRRRPERGPGTALPAYPGLCPCRSWQDAAALQLAGGA